MPRVDSVPRSCYGKMAILVHGEWWLLGTPIGSLGVPGYVAAYCRRIMTSKPPVMLRASMIAPNSITIEGHVQYDQIVPVLWEKSDDKVVIDPLAAGLVDDGSLGAYVGEPHMLAKAPKRTKGKRK